jgi:hypothetical protein
MASEWAAAAGVPLPAAAGVRQLRAEDVVTANITKLCNKMVPGISDSTLQYCMKILSSRLAAGPSAVRSELHIIGKIRKMVDRQASSRPRDEADHNSNPQLIRAEELDQKRRLVRLERAVQRVRQSPLVKQTWSVFHLLYSLRNSSAGAPGGGPFRVIEPPSLAGDVTRSITAAAAAASAAAASGGGGAGLPEGEEASIILGTDSAFPPLRPGTKTDASSLAGGKSGGYANQREARQAELASSSGFRIGSFSHELSEQLLLRDIVFALQGIDGEYVKYDTAVKGYVVDASVGVPGSTRQLIRRICEGGWLFRQVSTFLARCNASHTTGLVHQGMCQAMQTEVTEYYRLIAVLKEQVNIDISSIGQDVEQLSLRRLCVRARSFVVISTTAWLFVQRGPLWLRCWRNKIARALGAWVVCALSAPVRSALCAAGGEHPRTHTHTHTHTHARTHTRKTHEAPPPPTTTTTGSSGCRTLSNACG